MAKLTSATTLSTPHELPPEIAHQRVLDERTAACFLGISQPTLERMRKYGTAPRHVMLSARRLGYRICDLLAWVEARTA